MCLGFAALGGGNRVGAVRRVLGAIGDRAEAAGLRDARACLHAVALAALGELPAEGQDGQREQDQHDDGEDDPCTVLMF